jgi:hypothetical protein
MTLRRAAYLAGIALIVLGVVVAGHWGPTLHVLGVTPATGPIYNWWSGSGSVLMPPLIQVLGFGIIMWGHTRCHVTECLRRARHEHGPYKVCGVHHPHVAEGPITAHAVATHGRDWRGGI